MTTRHLFFSTIKARLIFVGIVYFLTLGSVSGLSFYYLYTIHEHAEEVIVTKSPSLVLLDKAHVELVEGINHAYLYVLLDDQREKELYKKKMLNFDETVIRYKNVPHLEEEEEGDIEEDLINDIIKDKDELGNIVTEIFAAYEENRNSAVAAKTDANAETLRGKILSSTLVIHKQAEIFNKLTDLEVYEIENLNKGTSDVLDEALAVIPIIIILNLLVLFGLEFFAYKSVLKPINALKRSVEQMIAGDYKTTIAVGGITELNSLATSLNKMAAKVSETEKILEEKIADRTQKLEESGNGLEIAVTEKTKELQEKIAELEKVNTLIVGRELEMMKMKEELNRLKKGN